MAPGGIRAGVDVGGTFTDVVVIGDGGLPRAVKVPTTPADQSEAVQRGLALAAPNDRVALVAHGTTTATNAVLERDVGRTVLVTTAGFADVLTIARQDRPALYDLSVTRPDPLVPRSLVVCADERTGCDGRPVVALADAEVRRVVDAVAALEPDSVAVSLLFSFAADGHERRIAEGLQERLNVPVTLSSRLLPEFREYERASTCVLNAAVAPKLRRYLSGLQERLPDVTITVMTSGGGTASLGYVREAPVHTLLSGPAAGVVAAGAVARSAGYDDAVAFDMGGTSTDVCLIRGGRPEVSTDAEIGGLPFRTPAVGVHTVGAGGGSSAWVDAGGALRVGPRSAGAHPGPACYSQGGTAPTVTDAHCVLGHLGEGQALGGLRLDAAKAAAALGTLPEEAGGAAGVLTVVRATMGRALRRVTTERGVDPAGLALVAYGGAGPLHATAIGRDLGCRAVVVPPAPGVLSALGLLLAPPRYETSRTVMAAPGDALEQLWRTLEDDARTELARQGVSGDVRVDRLADARYAGQSHELRLAVSDGGDVASLLHAAHADAYGYAMTDEPVEVVTLRVVAEGAPALTGLPSAWDQGDPSPASSRRIGVGDGEIEARVVDRSSLAPGDEVGGPALVEQHDTTTLLAPGDVARVDAAHNLVVTWATGP